MARKASSVGRWGGEGGGDRGRMNGESSTIDIETCFKPEDDREYNWGLE